MKKIKALLLTSLVSLSASAQEPCKAYVGMEGGYDFGYDAKSSYSNITDPAAVTETKFTSLEKQQRGLTTGINFGYNFNDAMSGELGLEWSPKLKSSISVLDIETRKLGAKATVNYQWNTSIPVAPFVFAGVGIMHLENTLMPGSSATALATVGGVEGDSLKLQAIDSAGALTGALLDKSDKIQNKTVARVHGGFGLSMAASDKMAVVVKYGLAKNADYTIKTSIAAGVATAAAEGAAATLDATKSISMKDIKVKGQMEQSLTVGVKITL